MLVVGVFGIGLINFFSRIGDKDSKSAVLDMAAGSIVCTPKSISSSVRHGKLGEGLQRGECVVDVEFPSTCSLHISFSIFCCCLALAANTSIESFVVDGGDMAVCWDDASDG